MRKHMDVVNKAVAESEGSDAPLFEMPKLHTTPEDFGLGDPATNRSEYERLAEVESTPIIQNKDFLLAHARDDGKNEIFLLNFKQRLLLYYVEYKVMNIPGIGLCASQVVLWRRSGAGVPGITTKVFNGFLLKTFAGVVSDKEQTLDGRRFWIDRLSEAAMAGQSVGLLDGGRIVSMFKPGESFDEWIAHNDGWGKDDRYREMQYFISTKPVTVPA